MWGDNYCDDERPHTPALEPVDFKYTPPASPISFIPRRRPMTDVDPGDQQPSRKRGRNSRDKPRPSQGDVVLLGYLDPNRPDIAALAATKTLFSSESASERGGTNDDEDSRMDEDDEPPSAAGTKSSQLSPLRLAPQGANSFHPGEGRGNSTGGQSVSPIGADAEMPDVSPELEVTTGSSDVYARSATRSVHALPELTPRHPDTSRGLALSQGPVGSNGAEQSIRTGAQSAFRHKSSKALPNISDSIVSSPKLAPHIMLAPQKSPLKAQHPLPAPLSLPSANSEQSLPPVKHLVRMAETQDEAVLNQRPRTPSLSSTSSVFGGNANSQISAAPASATSAHFFGPPITQTTTSTFQPLSRTQTDPTPLPLPIPSIRHASTNPADFAMNSGSNSQLLAQQHVHSASSLASTSTAGATPGSANDALTPSDRSSTLSLPVSPDRATHSTSVTATQGASTAGGGPTLYRCTHPGCRAPPFQTPYLLNSHRNVHSSDRPYFCPRKDCPRSLPGKGFKRKNEMLRHGLVHDSPGYVCPFCSPEKEHRYPRPDNLQRHVKMHHEDTDPEDARLKEVLGQRRTVTGGSANVSISNKVSDGGNVSTTRRSGGNDSGKSGPGPSNRSAPVAEYAQVSIEGAARDNSATPRARRKKVSGALGP